MKPATKRRPIDHVTPRLGGERVARMWSVIEAAQEPPPRNVRGLGVAFAALAALAALGWSLWPAGAAPLASGDVVTVQHQATALHLPDGSELRASEATQLRVLRAEPEEVELQLAHGTLHCDVSHRPRRRFAVQAGDITVLVRGTKFTVESLESGLRVQVERGLVEVRSRSVILASLSAGQSWTQQKPPVAVEPETEPAAPELPSEAMPSSEAAPALPSPPSERAHHIKRTLPKPAAPTAAELLERANDARVAGDARTAADLYQQLRQQYPNDPRAGLSAFELARISLHALHDPARALSALRFARVHGQGFARDDADALEVEALGQTDEDACAAARVRFLLAHPQSAHRARVEHACPD